MGALPHGERAQIAFVISVFVAASFYFSGLSVLAFFGISLPAFRIAVILFILGLKMVGDDFTASFAEAAAKPRQAARRAPARRTHDSCPSPCRS